MQKIEINLKNISQKQALFEIAINQVRDNIGLLEKENEMNFKNYEEIILQAEKIPQTMKN